MAFNTSNFKLWLKDFVVYYVESLFEIQKCSNVNLFLVYGPFPLIYKSK